VAAKTAEGEGEDCCETDLYGIELVRALVRTSMDERTDSQHKTKMSRATLVCPCVKVAARQKMKQPPR
jgi:hypothetical protein